MVRTDLIKNVAAVSSDQLPFRPLGAVSLQTLNKTLTLYAVRRLFGPNELNWENFRTRVATVCKRLVVGELLTLAASLSLPRSKAITLSLAAPGC